MKAARAWIFLLQTRRKYVHVGSGATSMSHTVWTGNIQTLASRGLEHGH